jgi:hypothetical protein
MFGELAVFAGTSGPSVIHHAASYLDTTKSKDNNHTFYCKR